jgi:ribosomal protein L11 methyltransferase
VEVLPAGPGSSEVRVYLGRADDPAAWRERALRVLRAHGLSPGLSDPTLSPVPDRAWAARWQASLAPIPLGLRFVVLPTPELAAPEGREPIRLVPGMAFGTGEHATTRMCALVLERRVREGSRWLDLGTGTGILALVAARCGAASVLALDLDPEAAHVAAHVVAENGAGRIVAVAAGSLDRAGGGPFDGVVANVQSSFFLASATALAEVVRPGGALVISGFLDEDVSEITAALAAAGFGLVERFSDGPWACLHLMRTPR